MEIVDPKQVDLDFYNTIMSPKGAFFPHKEDLSNIKIGKPLSEAEPLLFNMKPAISIRRASLWCQKFWDHGHTFMMLGSLILTGITEENPQPIFGYAFDLDKPVDPADFFNTLGIYAADPEGSDIFMVKKKKELLFKSITHKGEKLLAHLSILARATSADEKYLKNISNEAEIIKHASPAWIPKRLPWN